MAPTKAKQVNSFLYYKKIRTYKVLYNAWNKVYKNGIKSKSDETRRLIKEFKNNYIRNIERIYRKLLRDDFKFYASKGVPLTRKRKSPRPIVIAPIENRIVQRCILDILQSNVKLKKYFNNPFSFGGIKDEDKPKNVSLAVKTVQKKIAYGAKWYIKSDIKDFFTKIPKHIVIQTISSLINDEKFIAILKEAVDVELENLNELGKKADLFPIYEVGVAQGCCLSPLIGNILLNGFDSTLNDKGISCFRYIDDFIILASTRKKVIATFKNGLKILKNLGLEAYNPINNNDGKAKIDRTDKIIDFLGCEIEGKTIRPNKESRKRMLSKIDSIIKESKHLMRKSPKDCYESKKGLVDTFKAINNKLQGWGNQYKYCNDKNIFLKIDTSINKRIKNYLTYYQNQIKKYGKDDFINKRRLLGIYILYDSFIEK